MKPDHLIQLATLLDTEPALLKLRPLTGGSIARVYRVDSPRGVFVFKTADAPRTRLDIEAGMLRYLRVQTDLPVPEVIGSAPNWLVLTFLPGGSIFTRAAETHAAELIATLHAHTAPAFGFLDETLIGGLRQPNTRSAEWIPFFRDQRLRYMADEALRVGQLPEQMRIRIESLTYRLDDWLEEPDEPALIHGDLWTTNILADATHITGFLDPSLYYAHPEIELAFTTLFSTFGAPFFERYHALRPISPGFFEYRRDLYNLYPLLVHVRLFGGQYVGAVDQVLRRFGF